MLPRLLSLLPFLLCPALLPSAAPPQTPWGPNSPNPTAADAALRAGQAAMDADRFDEAIGHFRRALKIDPALAQGRLSLAAAHLALGQDNPAAVQLAAYLRAKPDHFLIRMPFAEVLARLDRTPEAAEQLEGFIAAIQDLPRLADDHLIACHTRLMELATRHGDEYGERLHRGVGLYLLALKRGEMGGAGAARLAEELLCKAAGELTLAHLQRPSEARPAWYLHGVWRQLGQRQPAERALRAAGMSAGLSYLTTAELRAVHLALTELETGGRKR